MAASTTSENNVMGIAIMHPATAGGKTVKGNFRDVAANHRCRSAAGAPGRIIGDYQLVDDSGNKISTLDPGAQVVLEIGYTQADLNRASGNAKARTLPSSLVNVGRGARGLRHWYRFGAASGTGSLRGGAPRQPVEQWGRQQR